VKVTLSDKSKRRLFDQAACFAEDKRVVVGNIEGRSVVGSEKPPGRRELCYIKYTTIALHFQAILRSFLAMTVSE
jgi:hypothetical protein